MCRSRGGYRILRHGGRKFFYKFMPKCDVLVEEFLCYCRFRCFLNLKFFLLSFFSSLFFRILLVVDMFSACVL